MQTRWVLQLIAAAAVWAASYPALATERHVPGECGTIQAAIDACVAGDVVIVADGTYTGVGNKDLNFGGKAITVRSASGNPATCIIDCEGSGRGFYFHTNETAAAVVRGFTIRNGLATSSSPGGNVGGGIYCQGSSPTITNCTIASNHGSWGGGLYLCDCSPMVANTTFTGNSADRGGGLFLVAECSPTIANNTITNNGASFGGGGVYLWNSSPILVNNTVVGNFTDRGETSPPGDGGGLYAQGSSLTIVNTIFVYNTSGIYRLGTTGPATLQNNCVYGNTAYNYSGITDPTGTNGNISVDPAFAGQAYGGWHLRPDSPCVGAGDNAAVYGDVDIDGQARIQPADGRVDIGADESDGTTPPPGPFVIVRVSPLGHDEHDGSSWELAKRTVQAGIQAAAAVGGEVWVQAGTYYERITLASFAHVYGGFGGLETARDERDWSAHVTVLDADGLGTVVTATLLCAGTSTLDGFTITHGVATMFGGGLYVNSASPVIRNNRITLNSASVEGGGLYVDGVGCAAITRNTIANNSAFYGGGVATSFDSSPTIVKNTIASNSAEDGGGFYLRASAPTIVGNEIIGNSASQTGGGLLLTGSSATIANNVIGRNTARYRGGGLYIMNNSAAAVANNTITGNVASFAGGLCVYDSSPTIANTIVAFNSAGIVSRYGTPTLRYNCVYANTDYDYYDIADPTGTDGNISADPLFRDPAGPDNDPNTWSDNDYRLAPGSPCIDAGSNSAVPADTLDLDGDGNTTEPLPFDLAGRPRFVDDPNTPDCPWAPGTCGTAPIVDMGAYEFQGTTHLAGDLSCDGIISYADINPFVLALSGQGAYEARYPNCRWLNADCNADGVVSYADINAFVRVLSGQ